MKQQVNYNTMAFGVFVRRRRINEGLTPRQLCDAANLDPRTLDTIECYRYVRKPRKRTVNKIAECLSIPPKMLFDLLERPI
jgi:transcriptional regulator with XRE-family HTH domain